MSALKRTYHVSESEGTGKRFRKIAKSTGLTTPIYKSIRQYIKKSINSKAELKFWSLYAANNAMQTGQGLTYPFQSYIGPQISQGTQDGQRIGNKITVTSAYLDLVVNLLPYNAVTNPLPTPLWVRVMVLKYKKQMINSVAGTDVNSALFQVTNGSVACQGNSLDMTFPINPESWSVVADKTVRLGSTAPSSTGPVSTGGYFDNSKMSEKMRIDLKSTGVWEYNDATTTATNKNLWLFIQPVSCDGSAGGVYFQAECHYNAVWRYQDM